MVELCAWKVAGSLDQLLAQLDELAPRRSKASDGAIGDAVHASRDSDHNPWFELAGQPYVTARDFTHDPRGGLSCEWLAEQLRLGRDQRVKYVIWDHCIMAGSAGPAPWSWRPYRGANAHEHHLHLSVVADARSLTRIPWRLAAPPLEDDMNPEDRERLERVERGVELILQQLVGPGATIANPWPGAERGGGWERWRPGQPQRLTLVDFMRELDRDLHADDARSVPLYPTRTEEGS